ncbi:RNase adapter RapZ [Marinihelvus fidelis]|uniref:RNase adapter RapZ n=1 Tax=Marinihelvus fidelis TaxID=2613842 RepID=A0A5N0TEG2_9GAMM|nr:RNase adapter RapZ [Marinihelvus fidelis]KAA9133425.1 RNase adapter RapZ [Marinihelvus fidelis]
MNTEAQPQIVIVSGLSGAGKSTALKALEDMGFHCIDNLPARLMNDFANHVREDRELYRKVALGIDARAPGLKLDDVPGWLDGLRESGLNAQLLFLGADDATLVKRFSKTRRRHPLSQDQRGLKSAIAHERELLRPVADAADHVIDTSTINIHQLTHETWKCVARDSRDMTVVLQSFGFSHGAPTDVDFLFDARCLPNPHWDKSLRPKTGRDAGVAEWLQQEPLVQKMGDDILAYLKTWLPEFERVHRAFVTVGIGCTGGRHRSVYLAERLKRELSEDYPEVVLHHRELSS